MQVQVHGVQGYDEDQIALVIPDMSKFVVQVPVILGTLMMISHVMNVIKEGEIDALVMPWVNACVAYILAVRWAIATIEDGAPSEESDPNDYDEIVTTKEAETIDAFSSQVIPAKMKTAHWGEGINMMTQALHIQDRSLPQGLMVQNAYTELQGSSKTSL